MRELAQVGARFDRARDGELSLGREGGHRRNRIAHAGGDATGAEIERALVTRVLDATDVEVVEHALLLDLLTDAHGAVAGLTLHVMGEGARDGVGAVRARAVVLATGGIGQVYASTTNPSVSTGDGVAAALRAGAVVRDLEFVQFHPTVTWLGPHSRGQQPLVSEAVRGEGAFLVDDAGERFMTGAHELADLAPRDVVAKAILRRMRETGADHVWLDARHFGAETWRVRFPTINATLLSLGVDPARDLIPVVPACHYASGGVRMDLSGESSLPGLFACGEAACTGVHGANRLASNSLLEGLVFGHRIAETLIARLAHGTVGPPARQVAAGPLLPDVGPSAAAAPDVARCGRAARRERARPGRAGAGRSRGRRRRVARHRGVGDDEPADRGGGTDAGGPAAGGDARHALARRLPAARRRALARAPGHRAHRSRVAHDVRRDPGMTLPDGVDELVARALAEDLGAAGDVTTRATVAATQLATAEFVARHDGVVAGLPVRPRC